MTITELSQQREITLPSARKAVLRAYAALDVSMPPLQNDDELSQEIIDALNLKQKKTVLNGSTVMPESLPKSAQSRKRKAAGWKVTWVDVLPVAPLPLLGLGATYGVYHFSSFFTTPVFAVVLGSAFELTYIGMAVMVLRCPELAATARKVSLSAVLVSIIYNVFSGALYFMPTLMQKLPPHDNSIGAWVSLWVLCILHGAPLPGLAFAVSEAVPVFYRKVSEMKNEGT